MVFGFRFSFNFFLPFCSFFSRPMMCFLFGTPAGQPTCFFVEAFFSPLGEEQIPCGALWRNGKRPLRSLLATPSFAVRPSVGHERLRLFCPRRLRFRHPTTDPPQASPSAFFLKKKRREYNNKRTYNVCFCMCDEI